MIQKRRVLINAISSVIQTITVAGVLFVLYRFILHTIGVKKLGVWSVVLAITSVASIANLGLSASVVKFVAKYVARDQKETVAGVIQTAVVSIAVIIGILLLVIYPFAGWLLRFVVPSESIKDALSILPYGLIALWLTMIASVFQSGLEGHQRVDLRSILFTAGAVFYLILCFLLVPSYGLMGLAYARVIQAIALMAGSWLLLRRLMPGLPIIRYRWNRRLFREMMGYGLNFQVISISQLLYDPITKSLLTKFGGLSITGFYEMASRMILQLRALLVSANRVLVPTIADLQERNSKIIDEVYKDSYNLMLYLALPLFFIVVALTPIISRLWIGYYQSTFVTLSILLAIGWLINTLTAPAYFANLGIGELRWNTIGHVIIAVLNFSLGLLLGRIYGGMGVTVAWVFALIVGSLVITLSYHLKHKIRLLELLSRENSFVVLGALCASAIAISLYRMLNSRLNLASMLLLLTFVFLGVVSFPLWKHPIRRKAIRWISAELLKGK